MLKSQEIQLAQSKRREKIASIQKADEITDDARKELRSLTDAYEGAEVELRASLLLEGAERDKIKEPDKAQTDFERECRSFSLSALLASQTEGKPLAGREAEVVAELETRSGPAQKGVKVPWEALLSLETRADAVTDSGASANLAQKPVAAALERFFEASAAAKFGIQALQVTGAPSFPEVTAGASIHWVSEGTGVDAEAITTATKTSTIKTAMGRYLLSRQAVKQNSALEMVLRRDLTNAQATAMISSAWAIAETFTRRGYRGATAGIVTVEVSSPMPYRWPRWPYPSALTIDILAGGIWVPHTETYVPALGLIELEPFTIYRLTQSGAVAAPTIPAHVTQAVENLALYMLTQAPTRREYKSQSAGDSALTREAMMGLLYGSGAGALLAGEVLQ